MTSVFGGVLSERHKRPVPRVNRILVRKSFRILVSLNKKMTFAGFCKLYAMWTENNPFVF